MIRIITHSGCFHCDEVVACAILKYLYPGSQTIRTRDPEVIESGDIVVDVGRKYCPDDGRFDHHQEECHETFDDKSNIPLSSAGMIFKHFGIDLMKKYAAENQLDEGIHENEWEGIQQTIYRQVFLEIDALDNGVPMLNVSQLDGCKVAEASLYNYRVFLSLTGTVSRLNYSANLYDHQRQMQQFEKAVNYAWETLRINFDHYLIQFQQLKRDMALISTAMDWQRRVELCPDARGQIIVVEQDCPNWKICLSRWERENPICEMDSDENARLSVKFIVYPNEGTRWGVRTIQDAQFKSRRDLKPTEWLKDRVERPDEIVFVHKKLFIAVCETLETALEVAFESLE